MSRFQIDQQIEGIQFWQQLNRRTRDVERHPTWEFFLKICIEVYENFKESVG